MLYKCLSMILTATIFIESSVMGYGYVPEEIIVDDIVPIVNEEIIVEEPVEEIIDIIEEPVVESVPVIEEPVVEILEEKVEVVEPIIQNPSTPLAISESDIDLIALVTMAEAEGECEEGKRLVIDVILNRYESTRFPNTISGVIYAKNAFECMWNGRVNRCYVREDIRQLVIEELQSRTNSNIHYFRTNHYHNFGKPVVNVGNHYFSTY